MVILKKKKKKTALKLVEKPVVAPEPAEEVEEEGYEEEVEEETPEDVEGEEPTEPQPKKKALTVSDILINHEQRLVEMEAKWYRLGGI